jgi:hypothetical protein
VCCFLVRIAKLCKVDVLCKVSLVGDAINVANSIVCLSLRRGVRPFSKQKLGFTCGFKYNKNA